MPTEAWSPAGRTQAWTKDNPASRVSSPSIRLPVQVAEKCRRIEFDIGDDGLFRFEQSEISEDAGDGLPPFGGDVLPGSTQRGKLASHPGATSLKRILPEFPFSSVRRLSRAFAMLLVVLCHGAAAVAATATTVHAGGEPLSRLNHRAWTVEDGAPPDIWALAQSRDGFIWLGTGAGLFRFDGVRFERINPGGGQRLASNNITALAIGDSGDMWIGYYAAGASLLKKDGTLTHYGVGEGMPDGAVYRFCEDRSGRLWAANDGGLVYFENGRWNPAGTEIGYPAHRAVWITLDSRGDLWVATGQTIVVRRLGEHRFTSTGAEVPSQAVLEERPGGRLWISDSVRGTRPLPDPSDNEGHELAARGATIPAAKRLLFRKDGSLWATDAEHGGFYRVEAATLARVEHGSSGAVSVEGFSRAQGLTAEVAVPLLDDAEGNVWVGTNLGLNRLRHNNVSVLRELAATAHEGFGVAPAPDHGVFASSGGILYRADGLSAERLMGGIPPLLAAHMAGDGRLWLISSAALQRIDGGKLVRIELPGQRLGREIRAIASTADGSLFASIAHQGLYVFREGNWVPVDAGSGTSPSVLATDATDRLWQGYPNSRVVVRDGDSALEYSAAQGLAVGNITAIHVGGRHVLVAGEHGLAALVEDRFRSLDPRNDGTFDSVTGIVESDDASYWLNGSRGIIRVTDAELMRAFAEPGHEPDYALFNAQDGLPGVALQAGPSTTAFRSMDGLLWFSTNRGVAVIDPRRVHRNPRPPDVFVDAIVADGRILPADMGLRLPAGTSALSIAYTATSFSMPERVRFRYRLEGADGQWQEAGTRREAFYTNPGPGNYRFQVIAANNDGVWNEEGASLEFRIEPRFVQTWWFFASCILAACGVMWSLYLLRLRQLGMHIRNRLHERHMERERIARELHDTLLQSIQGLILRFQAAAATIPVDQPSRQAMESALERADEVIAEGRDRVLDLRASSAGDEDLAQAFSRVGEELQLAHTAQFRVIIEGVAKPLDPIVRDELFRIGREALVNACQHAGAQNIEVRITHARSELRLSFGDDGRGIDPAVLEEGGRPGHWGLTGMRERAGRIEADLSVRSHPGAGTQVEVRMKASLAYRPCLEKSRWKWLRNLVGRSR